MISANFMVTVGTFFLRIRFI